MNRLAAVVLAAVVLLPSLAAAGDRATTKEAEMIVRKAVEYVKANGKEKALAAFNAENGPFTYRDLYIFALDLETGLTRAHGAKPALAGKSHLDLKDANGKLFNREILATAKAAGRGWVEYVYRNPATGKDEQKVVYLERVDGLAVACGAYLPR